jgi:hypothetical protein
VNCVVVETFKASSYKNDFEVDSTKSHDRFGLLNDLEIFRLFSDRNGTTTTTRQHVDHNRRSNKKTTSNVTQPSTSNHVANSSTNASDISHFPAYFGQTTRNVF